jgi:hypothetical protein
LISDRKKGDIMKKRMNETSKSSAALLVIKNGTCYVLGQELNADIKLCIKNQCKERRLKKQKIEYTQISNVTEADRVINQNKGKVVIQSTLNNWKIVVQAVKNQDDDAMPQKKKALCKLYLKCMNRI